MLGKMKPLILCYMGLWLWKRKRLEIIEKINLLSDTFGRGQEALELWGFKN